ncbi:DUF2207 domain-containing protein [Candidatus Woesearchaeota archaeon]|nr:DUF2207 domain-containing protein [Candidatus Woesearchaeota archaeon]
MNKKFLVNLRPGIAGYIVDGRIADKEVIATIVDFIIKGYIDFSPKKTNWEKLRVKELISLSKARPSLKFENEFLNVLFSGKKKITIEDFKITLKDKKLHKVLEEEVKYSDVGIEIIDEELTGYYYNNENKLRKLKFPYYVDKYGNPGFAIFKSKKYKYERLVKTLEEWFIYKSVFNKFLIRTAPKLFLSLCGLIISGIIAKKSLFFMSGFVGLLGIIVFLFYFQISLLGIIAFLYFNKKTTKIFEQKIKYQDEITKILRKKYHELFDYVKKHPLKEGRLFNEFLPYTVAFGFDTHWQRAFSLDDDKEEFIYRG